MTTFSGLVRRGRSGIGGSWDLRPSRRTDVLVGSIAGLVLVVVIRLSPSLGFSLERLLSFALGAVVLLFMVRRPMFALKVTFVVVPASVFYLSALLSFGLPAPFVRSGVLLKDAVVVAVFVAGWRARRERDRPLATLDRVLLVYMGLIGLWFLLTPLIAAQPLTSDARIIGARMFLLFAGMFLGVRWLSPTAEQRRILYRWMFGALLIVAIVGLYERLRHDAYVDFLLDTVDIDRYYREVAGLSGPTLSRQIGWLSTSTFRGVSLLLVPFPYADLMLAGFASAVALLTAGRNRILTIAAAAYALGVVFSGTRINLIAVAAVMIVLFLDGRGLTERVRIQVVAIGLVAMLAFAPALLSSRLLGADNQESNEGHRNELAEAFGDVVSRPIGHGLGADGTVLRRFQRDAPMVSGNTILSIGVQAGAVAMGAFLWFLFLLARELQRRLRQPRVDWSVRASFLILVGGLVATSTHHGWTDLASGSFIWAAIALGVGELDDTGAEPT